MAHRSKPERLRNWGQQQLADAAFRTVAASFLPASLPLAPIKGFALGRWLYDDVSERGLRDIDLLVRPDQMAIARRVVKRAGWRIAYDSPRLNELLFFVDGVAVEVHGEIGRRDLAGLLARDVLARATPDVETFGFECLQIDDIDHFLLLAANVIKDRFWKANAQVAEDLQKLWPRIAPQRLSDLLDRTQQAGFGTALASVAEWLVAQGASEFAQLTTIGPKNRMLEPHLLRYLQHHDLGQHLGLLIACAANDRLPVRLRCLGQLLQSGIQRFVRSSATRISNASRPGRA